MGISLGEPSDLPSGVRLVPEPTGEVTGPSRAPAGESSGRGMATDPWEGEGLPTGEGGLLPWHEFARGGQGLKSRSRPKTGKGDPKGKGKQSVRGGLGKVRKGR